MSKEILLPEDTFGQNSFTSRDEDELESTPTICVRYDFIKNYLKTPNCHIDVVPPEKYTKIRPLESFLRDVQQKRQHNSLLLCQRKSPVEHVECIKPCVVQLKRSKTSVNQRTRWQRQRSLRSSRKLRDLATRQIVKPIKSTNKTSKAQTKSQDKTNSIASSAATSTDDAQTSSSPQKLRESKTNSDQKIVHEMPVKSTVTTTTTSSSIKILEKSRNKIPELSRQNGRINNLQQRTRSSCRDKVRQMALKSITTHIPVKFKVRPELKGPEKTTATTTRLKPKNGQLQKCYTKQQKVRQLVVSKHPEQTVEKEELKSQQSIPDLNHEAIRANDVQVVTSENDLDVVVTSVDVQNFIDDMLELDRMSSEHRQNVITSRLHTSPAILKRLRNGDSHWSNLESARKACEIFTKLGDAYSEQTPSSESVTRVLHYRGTQNQCGNDVGDDDSGEVMREKRQENSSVETSHHNFLDEHRYALQTAPEAENEMRPASKVVPPTSQLPQTISGILWAPIVLLDNKSVPSMIAPSAMLQTNENKQQKPQSTETTDTQESTVTSTNVNPIHVDHTYVVETAEEEPTSSSLSSEEVGAVKEVDHHQTPPTSTTTSPPLQLFEPALCPRTPLKQHLTTSKSQPYHFKETRGTNHLLCRSGNNATGNSNTGGGVVHSTQHPVEFSEAHGPVLGAFYLNHHLVLTQHSQVSFWTQSALGHLLCAQTMWLPCGRVDRLTFTDHVLRPSAGGGTVCSLEHSIVYTELWCHQHKSDLRQRPVADIFACVYFWGAPPAYPAVGKKVVQLENVKALSKDVQYSLLEYSATVVVSWYQWVEQDTSNTCVRMYRLADDYQTVASVRQLQPVDHYVAVLRNIDDCENLILGCGENRLTLWNIEYGNIVATIRLNEIPVDPIKRTVWAKCDRGFLFTINECSDSRELSLLAINGRNHSWKRLSSFQPPVEYKNLIGVFMDCGLLVAYYREGILCWSTQTNEIVVEEVANQHTQYAPCGRFIAVFINGTVIVKNVLHHFLTADD